MMDIKDGKEQLLELLPDTIKALKSVLRQESAAPVARMKAAEMVLNRIGLPALKAVVTKQIVSPEALPVLPGDREKLLLDKARTDKEIEELKKQLEGTVINEGSNSIHIQG